jgi:hypothetical protein
MVLIEESSGSFADHSAGDVAGFDPCGGELESCAYAPNLEKGSYQAGLLQPPGAAERFDEFIEVYNHQRPTPPLASPVGW